MVLGSRLAGIHQNNALNPFIEVYIKKSLSYPTLNYHSVPIKTRPDYLIYKSLHYFTQREADKFLFPGTLLDSLVEKPSCYDQFTRLSPGQAVWLVRMAMAG